MKLTTALFGFGLTIILALPVVAYSATHIVSPLALNFDLESRDIVESSLTLTNPSDQQIRLYASVNQVSTNGEGVLESFQPPASVDRTNTPTSWIEITRSRIELLPGEKKEIPFTIRMNPKTEAGDYDVFIGFASGSNQPAATKKVVAGEAPGTLIRISVDKKQNQFLRLERFSADRFVTGKEEESITFTLFNPGRAAVIPKGEVILYTTSGEEVAALPINEAGVSIAGEGRQEFFLPIPQDLGVGKYKAFLSVEYGEFFTASLNDTTFFYVFPLQMFLLFFAGVLILAVVITWLLYRRLAVSSDEFDADSVPMFITTEKSPDMHHDIRLSKEYEKPE